jgi:hypothetical protein
VAKDDVYLGIDLVWKGFTVGSAADLWGSIPYSELRTSTTPKLDSQLVVYDTVQGMLSRAIVALRSGVKSLATPPDLVFGGSTAHWIATAHTLKARYFLHTVEAAANGKLGARTAANVWNDVIAQRFTWAPPIRNRTCGSSSRTTRRSGETSMPGRSWWTT